MGLVHLQTLLWKCDCPGCSATAGMRDEPIPPGAETFLPILPGGWTVVGDLTLCSRHRVHVTVDGVDLQNMGSGQKLVSWLRPVKKSS